MIHQKISTSHLSQDEIMQTLQTGLAGQFKNQRILVLIPDHTRTLPLPPLFRALVTVLHDVRQLDFMVALGTHHALSEDQINKLVGITAEERLTDYETIRFLNHAWDDPSALQKIGIITQDQVQEFTGKPQNQLLITTLYLFNYLTATTNL